LKVESLEASVMRKYDKCHKKSNRYENRIL